MRQFADDLDDNFDEESAIEEWLTRRDAGDTDPNDDPDDFDDDEDDFDDEDEDNDD